MNKLIIFDCDGTLVDSEVIATEVFTSYWATHGVHVSHKDFKENFIGKGNLHPDNADLFKKMPPHAMEEGDRLWDEALKRDLKPVEEMLELVASLKGKISVGSNSSLDHVKWALEKTKLDRFFGENVFSAQQVENPKPDPDLFLYIANKLEVNTKDCIVIEDSVSGIRAAKNAGMKVVAFTGAGHFIPSLEEKLKLENPDFFCSNANELREVLN